MVIAPFLDLRPLNRVVSEHPFKMITMKQILLHIQPVKWFVLVDLKDAYFHIQIVLSQDVLESHKKQLLNHLQCL